jgi:hypothetical protein
MLTNRETAPMIARHETHLQWRQDGRPATRDGKHFARFVAFIDAQFVRERFDARGARASGT